MNGLLPAYGVYGITPAALCDGEPARLYSAVEQAALGGLGLLQYRDKHSDAARRLKLACGLARLCAALGIPLIINDDARLAAACGAAGVHLGQGDGSVASARALLGAQAIIGVTCGNDLGRARRAAAEGADYVAFGAFYPSRTKPGAPAAALSLLSEAIALQTPPLCAIGGVTASNGAALVEAGASYLAAVESVFGGGDIPGNVRALAQLFAQHHPAV